MRTVAERNRDKSKNVMDAEVLLRQKTLMFDGIGLQDDVIIPARDIVGVGRTGGRCRVGVLMVSVEGRGAARS